MCVHIIYNRSHTGTCLLAASMSSSLDNDNNNPFTEEDQRNMTMVIDDGFHSRTFEQLAAGPLSSLRQFAVTCRKFLVPASSPEWTFDGASGDISSSTIIVDRDAYDEFMATIPDERVAKGVLKILLHLKGWLTKGDDQTGTFITRMFGNMLTNQSLLRQVVLGSSSSSLTTSAGASSSNAVENQQRADRFNLMRTMRQQNECGNILDDMLVICKVATNYFDWAITSGVVASSQLTTNEKTRSIYTTAFKQIMVTKSLCNMRRLSAIFSAIVASGVGDAQLVSLLQQQQNGNDNNWEHLIRNMNPCAPTAASAVEDPSVQAMKGVISRVFNVGFAPIVTPPPPPPPLPPAALPQSQQLQQQPQQQQPAQYHNNDDAVSIVSMLFDSSTHHGGRDDDNDNDDVHGNGSGNGGDEYNSSGDDDDDGASDQGEDYFTLDDIPQKQRSHAELVECIYGIFKEYKYVLYPPPAMDDTKPIIRIWGPVKLTIAKMVPSIELVTDDDGGNGTIVAPLSEHAVTTAADGGSEDDEDCDGSSMMCRRYIQGIDDEEDEDEDEDDQRQQQQQQQQQHQQLVISSSKTYKLSYQRKVETIDAFGYNPIGIVSSVVGRFMNRSTRIGAELVALSRMRQSAITAASEWITNVPDKRLPYARRDRTVWSFLNGVFFARSNVFVRHCDAKRIAVNEAREKVDNDTKLLLDQLKTYHKGYNTQLRLQQQHHLHHSDHSDADEGEDEDEDDMRTTTATTISQAVRCSVRNRLSGAIGIVRDGDNHHINMNILKRKERELYGGGGGSEGGGGNHQQDEVWMVNDGGDGDGDGDGNTSHRARKRRRKNVTSINKACKVIPNYWRPPPKAVYKTIEQCVSVLGIEETLSQAGTDEERRVMIKNIEAQIDKEFNDLSLPTIAKRMGVSSSIDPDCWVHIQTPMLDRIICYQIVSDDNLQSYISHVESNVDTACASNMPGIYNDPDVLEVYCWWMAMLGRLLFDVGSMDNWQVMTWCVGAAGTGKGALAQMIQEIYTESDVGVISDKHEPTFGLSPLFGKWVCIAPELKEDSTFPQAQFMSAVAGESISGAVKGNDPKLANPWLSTLLFCSNMMLRWEDTNENLCRRLVIFLFKRLLDPRIHLQDLNQRIKQEIANIIIKIVQAYHWAISVVGNSKIWTKLPKAMRDANAECMNQLSPLKRFMGNYPKVVSERYRMCKTATFNQHFTNWCKHNWSTGFCPNLSDMVLNQANIERVRLMDDNDDPETAVAREEWFMGVDFIDPNYTTRTQVLNKATIPVISSVVQEMRSQQTDAEGEGEGDDDDHYCYGGRIEMNELEIPDIRLQIVQKAIEKVQGCKVAWIRFCGGEESLGGDTVPIGPENVDSALQVLSEFMPKDVMIRRIMNDRGVVFV